MELHCVLLSSYLGLTGFSELVLLELGPPFKVTELLAQTLSLLISVQSICFLLTVQLVRFFQEQLLRFLLTAQLLCSLTAQPLRFLLAAQLVRLLM